MVANDAHLHLLLNHLPIIGALVSTLLLACGLAVRSKDLTRAAFALTLLFAVVTYPAAGSGREAEDVIEKMAGVSEDRIEVHEERAEKAVVAMYASGALALLGLALGMRGEAPRWAAVLCLVLLIATSGLMGWTGKAGGEIHHPETRPGFVAPEASGNGDENEHNQ
ncbi:MAG: hypothetical protein Q8R92_09785 [Deltaproteobacteria bacterium]|nr:hypothetical protein [Deltaproteobacteria bacterium]